ncbi:MAG: TetR/AcrR family transcriptional regulator, partial [Planctomycetota bacterium]
MVQIKPGGRPDAKRAEILRRAAQVFRRKGFHGAGMREIAKGLGMAPGALYYYFESKEDLLYA